MMMSPFINGTQGLLQSWKDLRRLLTSNLSDYEHLSLVINFWSFAPLSPRCLDWDCPEDWMDPWNLVYSNNFDESSISLGMMYTLLLSDDQRWTHDRCRLQLIKDDVNSIQKIILFVDENKLLNYEYKKIIDINSLQTTFFVQQEYIYSGKNYSIKDNRR